MIDFGSWVIVASLIGPSGQQALFTPSTLFDEVACRKEARKENSEALKEYPITKIIRFSTCRSAPPQ